jgi:poly-gamma-glutamate synthesis protein (capsule biosynthesis protein)
MLACLLAFRFFPDSNTAGFNSGAMEIFCAGAEDANINDVSQIEISTEKEPVLINLAGDVLLASGVGKIMTQKGLDYPWANVAGLLVHGDITMANLECCISMGGFPEPDKQFTFRAPPAVLDGAKRAGVDIFTLANNHVLDFGYPALKDTLENLQRSGILFTGAGLSLEQALTPVIFDKKDLRVGFLAFTRVFPYGSWVAGPKKWGIVSGFDHAVVEEAVKSLAEKTDVAVISVHWGKELADYPNKDQILFGRLLVDAGADVVIGHHPHVIQGIELYNNRIIAYSAGNFIFSPPSPKAGEGIVLQVEAQSREIIRARAIPTGIQNAQPRVLTGTDRQRVLKRLNNLSAGMNTVIDEEGFLIPQKQVEQ